VYIHQKPINKSISIETERKEPTNIIKQAVIHIKVFNQVGLVSLVNFTIETAK
jgi:hypothetical protein